VARELAYSYNVQFRLPSIPGAPDSGLPAIRRVDAQRGEIDGVTVGTDDPEGCRRFTATVIRGVKIGPSPAWLRDRLAAAGVRSISNVVDATNYVMLELNHPMHAYDLARVRGPEVVARRARNGEQVTTLDGVSRTLSSDMTAIADAGGAIGVGGVMGAANTEVSESTTDLLLECAWFEPRRVRRARRALNLPTDASHRFERGVDLWGLPEAQRRLAEIILATAGGKVTGSLDVWPIVTNPPRIFLRVARVGHLLGASLPVSAIEKYLVAAGCTVLYKPDDERLAVDVPGWRPDLEGEVDLIEEIARLHGYDNFPVELRPYRVGRLGDEPLDRAIAQVRNGLVELGLFEATLLPMGPPEGPASVRLLNPLSAEDSHLRETLLPGLSRAVETNWARHNRDIRLFEIGTGFRMAGAGQRPEETMRVAGVLSGARAPAHWTDAGRPPEYDGWDLAAVFRTATALANPAAQVQVDTGGWVARTPDGRLAGRAAQVDLGTPAWAAPVFGFEIEIAAEPRQPPRYSPLPTTPSAWRDVTLVLGSGVTAARVEAVMRSAAGQLLETVAVMSEFRSDQLGAENRAVQFRLVFRAPDRTVRDEEVDTAVSRVLKSLEQQLDAKLRAT
jgi:phenylalanyl-tRNA synthetase beta chain